MHIPDGFLDTKTAIATGLLAAGGLGVALRHAGKYLPSQRVPLLGLTAAFVFAAQMLNFPIPGATSGHLIGGVLAAILLGPSAAVIVIAAVLIIQCLLFQDGGVTALGANIFNMAMVSGLCGWFLYRGLSRTIPGRAGMVIGTMVGAWTGTVLASIVCVGELAASGTTEGWLAFWPMVGVHMLIGIGEGIITVLVVSAIATARPELMDGQVIGTKSLSPEGARPHSGMGSLIVMGMIVSLGLAIFMSPFASSRPDGLEKIAQTMQFDSREAESPHVSSPMPDYQMPGISSEILSTSLAGAAGTVVMLGLVWGVMRGVVRSRKDQALADETTTG